MRSTRYYYTYNIQLALSGRSALLALTFTASSGWVLENHKNEHVTYRFAAQREGEYTIYTRSASSGGFKYSVVGQAGHRRR